MKILHLQNLFTIHRQLEDIAFSQSLHSYENISEDIISLTKMKILLKIQSLQGIYPAPQLPELSSATA